MYYLLFYETFEEGNFKILTHILRQKIRTISLDQYRPRFDTNLFATLIIKSLDTNYNF